MRPRVTLASIAAYRRIQAVSKVTVRRDGEKLARGLKTIVKRT